MTFHPHHVIFPPSHQPWDCTFLGGPLITMNYDCIRKPHPWLVGASRCCGAGCWWVRAGGAGAGCWWVRRQEQAQAGADAGRSRRRPEQAQAGAGAGRGGRRPEQAQAGAGAGRHSQLGIRRSQMLVSGWHELVLAAGGHEQVLWCWLLVGPSKWRWCWLLAGTQAGAAAGRSGRRPEQPQAGADAGRSGRRPEQAGAGRSRRRPEPAPVCASTSICSSCACSGTHQQPAPAPSTHSPPPPEGNQSPAAIHFYCDQAHATD